MPKSTAARNLVLNYLYNNSAVTRPTAWYVALHTADPGTTGANEISGGGYARVAVTFGTSAAGSLSNTGVITFPAATGAQGTVTHASVWDALSGGNMYHQGTHTDPDPVINTGVTFSIAAGALVISET